MLFYYQHLFNKSQHIVFDILAKVAIYSKCLAIQLFGSKTATCQNKMGHVMQKYKLTETDYMAENITVNSLLGDSLIGI